MDRLAWLHAAERRLRPYVEEALPTIRDRRVAALIRRHSGNQEARWRAIRPIEDELTLPALRFRVDAEGCENVGGRREPVMGLCERRRGHCVISIHPALGQPEDVLDTLLHEMVHAVANDGADGIRMHGGLFPVVAGALGLMAPWSHTPPGLPLSHLLRIWARDLGPWVPEEGDSMQTSREFALPERPPGRPRASGTSRIVPFVRDCGPMSVADLAECFPTLNRATIRTNLRRAVANGELARDEHGQYGCAG